MQDVVAHVGEGHHVTMKDGAKEVLGDSQGDVEKKERHLGVVEEEARHIDEISLYEKKEKQVDDDEIEKRYADPYGFTTREMSVHNIILVCEC